MRQIVPVALLLTACAFLISLVYQPLQIPSLADEEHVVVNAVELNARTILVDIADTSLKRKNGLSGRESLAQDKGMLFVFPEDGFHSFWMKDMRFSIDILWISRAGIIVDMMQNVAPDTYPATFAPSKEARYVLELSSGSVSDYDVQIGDIVHL